MVTTKPVTAEGIELRPEGLTLVLSDRRISIPWEQCSIRLAKATQHERLTAQLSPGGYGIHWPLIDEDLAVHGLVQP